MGEMEVLPEDMSDAASDESDASVEEVEFTREELDAFLRRHGGSLSDAMAQVVCSEYAGFTYVELHMLLLGNTGHDLSQEEWDQLLAEDDDDEGTDADDDEGTDDEGTEVNGVPNEANRLDVEDSNARILEHYLSYPHMEMALVNDAQSKKAAAKIQHAWRNYSIRKDALILCRFSNIIWC
jgi:hypothetical protein